VCARVCVCIFSRESERPCTRERVRLYVCMPVFEFERIRVGVYECVCVCE
jgi:hypothetical protein